MVTRTRSRPGVPRDMNLPEPPMRGRPGLRHLQRRVCRASPRGPKAGCTVPPSSVAKHTGHAVLYAFDATTGKELYSSGELCQAGRTSAGFNLRRQGVCDHVRFERVRLSA